MWEVSSGAPYEGSVRGGQRRAELGLGVPRGLTRAELGLGVPGRHIHF